MMMIITNRHSNILLPASVTVLVFLHELNLEARGSEFSSNSYCLCRNSESLALALSRHSAVTVASGFSHWHQDPPPATVGATVLVIQNSCRTIISFFVLVVLT
jgi:hypothetical protein